MKAENMQNKELRFENEEIGFHQRLRRGYLELAKKETERFVVVDANGSIDEVFEELKSKILNKI